MTPEDLQYTADHEWLSVDDGVATIGITDYAQDQLGDIVYVSLPTVGDEVTAASAIGELESTKSVSDLFAPVTGEVVAANDALETSPDVVNTDPYGDGWLIKIRLGESGLPDDLLDADAYSATLDT